LFSRFERFLIYGESKKESRGIQLEKKNKKAISFLFSNNKEKERKHERKE
jgi:hypothetical protein